jgi:hypothetical protein
MRKRPWWFFPIGLIDVLYDPVDWPSKACGQLTVKIYEGGSTMKRNVMVLIVGLTLAVLLAGTGWASSSAATEEIQVTGTVLKGGRLVDDQGQEYQMAKDEGALEMEGQVGQKIEVKGTVLENSDGQKVIKINDYKVIKE